MTFQYNSHALMEFAEISEAASRQINENKPLDKDTLDTCNSIASYLDAEHMINQASDFTRVLWSAVMNESCPPGDEHLRSAVWVLSEYLEFTANCARASTEAAHLANESEKLSAPKRKGGKK